MGWDKFVYKFHIGVKKILAPLPKTKKKTIYRNIYFSKFHKRKVILMITVSTYLIHSINARFSRKWQDKKRRLLI